MFKINENYVIDASFFGNEARFLNHSCEVKLLLTILFTIF